MTEQGEGKNDRFDQAFDDMQGDVQTSLCEFQIKGDIGYNLEWHTTVEEIIVGA